MDRVRYGNDSSDRASLAVCRAARPCLSVIGSTSDEPPSGLRQMVMCRRQHRTIAPRRIGWPGVVSSSVPRMTIRLSGRDLDRDQLLLVARSGERVELEPAARSRMTATRDVVRRALERGDAVYGSSTAVGVLKRIGVPSDEAASYASWMIGHHLVYGTVVATAAALLRRRT